MKGDAAPGGGNDLRDPGAHLAGPDDEYVLEPHARTLPRLRATARIARDVLLEPRVLFLPRERLLELRDARVRETVAFAAARVPHYRAQGLDPAVVRGAEELAALPLLERAELQVSAARFRPEGGSSGGVMFRTTGSTAAPIEIVHARDALLANLGHSERERRVEARLVGRRYRYPIVSIRGADSTTDRVLRFYARESYRPLRPVRHPLTVETPLGQVVEAIERLEPAVVRGYGAYLELLFRFAAEGGLRHRPAAILYSGDTMSGPGREFVEQELGIPVLSAYNAVECLKIGFTCEARSGFHVHEDLCHVRLIGADENDVRPGERGEVVISNLVNRGTVLLNYRLGDVGRLDEAPCACGRSSARLVELEGRVDEVIRLAGDRFVYPTQIWSAFRGRPEVLRYQLAQVEPRRFELRVLAPGPAGARAAAAAADDLSRLLDGAHVEPAHVEALAGGRGGKFRHVVPLAAEDRSRA